MAMMATCSNDDVVVAQRNSVNDNVFERIMSSCGGAARGGGA